MKKIDAKNVNKYVPMDPYLALTYSKAPSKLVAAYGLISESYSDILKRSYSFGYSQHLRSIALSDPKKIDAIPRRTQETARSIYIYSNYGRDKINLSKLSRFRSLLSLSIGAFVEANSVKALKNIPTLRDLRIEEPVDAQIPFNSLPELKELSLNASENISNIVEAQTLNYLRLNKLKAKIELSALTMLSRLELIQCYKLVDLNMIRFNTNLRVLILYGCKNFVSLSGLENLQKLTHISIENCKNLSSFSSISKLSSLRHLEIRNCDNLRNLTFLENLNGPLRVFLFDCPNISSSSKKFLEGSSNIQFYCY